MRDALGALGPVDGINPELSNLTISVTALQKGDIVMVATDGLTDNFDPNVCKFTVNTVDPVKSKPTTAAKSPQKRIGNTQPLITENRVPVQRFEPQKPPVKPPRRSKNRENSRGSAIDQCSIKSNSLSDKFSSPSAENVQTDNVIDQGKKLSFLNELTTETGLHNSEEMNDEISSAQKLNKESDAVEFDNPLVAQFMSDNSLDSTKTKKGLIIF